MTTAKIIVSKNSLIVSSIELFPFTPCLTAYLFNLTKALVYQALKSTEMATYYN